ncbi:MAG: hypothetical protein LBR95_01930 [Azoarcus sp.]|nr:hypothetical protein [Azoarcus sp.]
MLPAPVFVPQKTAKAAAQWAVRHDLVDFADYTGINPEVANAWNRSLFDHVTEFPELRKGLAFAGSAQAHVKRYVEAQRAAFVKRAVERGVSTEAAEKWALAHLKPPRIAGKTYAQSIPPPFSPGVSVNVKFGKNPSVFQELLARDVRVGWHPVGCDTIRSVVDHELGHQLDELLGLSVDSAVKTLYTEVVGKGVKNAVSEYAGKSIQEFVAECWAEFLNNPSPRPTASAVGEIIRKRYEAKFR